MPNEKTYTKRCEDPALQWARYSGLIRFHNGDGFESAKSILPEIVAVVASFVSAIAVSVLSHRSENLDVVGPVRPVRMQNEGSHRNKHGPSSIVMALKRFSNFAIIVLSALVGCVQVFYHVLMLQLLWTYDGSRNYVDDNDGGSSVHEERQDVDGERFGGGTDGSTNPQGSRPLLANDGEEGSRGQAIPLRHVTSQVVDRHKIGQIFVDSEIHVTLDMIKGTNFLATEAATHRHSKAATLHSW
ncbi:hypothetical protein TELCIR_16890 [Teladorsagia circumcincta]|uniref:Uncharacterized protein n=1 Tax=Teladorsagia circumcincta TaxID=45464 RepID=A0A2G9TVX6_TELCI|nr:hypothetical protein TELCIR_16890 [Teladorsagia circumcincta]